MLNPILNNQNSQNSSSLPLIEPSKASSVSYSTQMRSMVQANDEQGLCDICSQTIIKTRNFFNWLWSTLFGSCSSNITLSSENTPSVQMRSPPQNASISAETLSNAALNSFNFYVQKNAEILDQHFSHNPYAPHFVAGTSNLFDPNLDPRSFATIVKIRYNGREEAYMAEQGCTSARGFFESKMREFLIRELQRGQGSQNSTPLEVQTLLIQVAARDQVIYQPFLSSVAFPDPQIHGHPEARPFANFTGGAGLPPLIRFREYVSEIMQGCSNSGSGNVFPRESFFSRASSGSCAQQVSEGINFLNILVMTAS
jgi:hypothetical protein